MKQIFTIFTSIVVFCTLHIATTFAEPQTLNQEHKLPSYLKPITPDKLKEDLDFLFKTIEEVHPNMHAYTGKEEFDPLQKQLYKSVNHPMNRIEFYKLTAPVVASLKNGHTFIEPPFIDFQEYAKKGGKIFSLGLYCDEESVILSDYYGPLDLSTGAEVLTIDNQNTKEFLINIAKYFAAEGKTHNLAIPQRKGFLPMFLWLEKGNVDSLILQIKTNDGDVKKYDIKALDYEELKNYQNKKANKAESETNSTSKPVDQSYSYRYISEYDTGLIEFNNFRDMKQFKKFLKETFTKIRDQNVSSLIIDIRKNPGGNSSLGDELLKYLTDKPFRQFEKVQIKISRQLFKNQSGLKKLFPDAAIGSTVTNEGEFKKPQDNPLRFKGRVFTLIGPKSASSSVSFASAVKHFQIGTLIGQETVDTPVSYGDCIYEVLPSSGLRFSTACKYFVKAGGKPDGRGLLPDYKVRQKPQDTTKDVDTVLQFTLNLIKNQQNKEVI